MVAELADVTVEQREVAVRADEREPWAAEVCGA